MLVLVTACGGSTTNPTSPTTNTTQACNPATSGYSEASFRQASAITARAMCDALREAAAGQREGDLKNIIQASFGRLGSGPPAFDSIVATGAHGIDYHYAGSDGLLVGGDLVDVDIGATYSRHASDMTRTFPVSRFTDRQRAIYQLVLEVQEAAVRRVNEIGVCGPAGYGYSIAGLHYAAVGDLQRSQLRSSDGRTMDQFLPHWLGHFVGEQVHGQDTGWSFNSPLRPNQVLAIEPGVYIPSEGIAIRIEDTYLVTSHGLECLTCGCGKGAHDMENRASLVFNSWFRPAAIAPSSRPIARVSSS